MKRIAIVGLGVIGASLGMALGATGKYHVIGIDKDPETLEIALEAKAAAETTVDVREGIRDAEVVFLAVPVSEIVRIAERIVDCLPAETIVTDVGSTKQSVVDVLEQKFSSRFVGGHPMTGSEYTGIKGADQYLFENALYVLTPTSRTAADTVGLVKSIVTDTGARVLCVSPQEHDMMVAAVSHLPHLLAVSLMNTACEIASYHPETLLLAAGGFRDVTRIASSQSVMWRDIYATNRTNIIEVSRKFRSYLEQIEISLEREDMDTVEEEIQKARRERDKIPIKIRGFLPSIHEVLVTVPDRPGSIAEVTGVVAAMRINIIDIEIVRIREGDGGTLRLAFATEEEADSAQEALRKRGFTTRRR